MSLNDPQWGRGGGGQNGTDESRNDNGRGRRPTAQEGPPDLEELWRDLNRRLNRLFGRGKRADDGEPGRFGGLRPSGRGAGAGAIVIVFALLVVWSLTGIFIVKEGQVGVLTTFGRYSGTRPAGFQWRMPWPVQSHEIVDVFSIRRVEVGTRGRQDRLKEALMLTDDENIVDMQFEVQYRIKEGPEGARDYLFNSRFTREGEGQVVVQTAESAMREVVGRRIMDSVLYESRQEIADQVRARMQEMLDRYGTGVLVSAVAIQNAQPPEPVQAAFDDAVKAGQDRERAINEGQAYSNDVVPKSRGLSSRLTQEAEGYKTRVIETAEGDASRFKQVLVEYNKAPAITRDRLYLDTMQQIFTSTTKIVVDARSGNNLLFLPFDKILQQATGNADGAARSAPVPVTPADPAPVSDSRSRADGARSRDRDSR
jgi:membrane protease subunit HflK